MSAFKHVFCKLGNMRKPASWVIYPLSSDVRDRVTIQCDKRIAQVRLDLGKATLSSGKGGHQGFLMLSQALGATVVDVPADILAELQLYVDSVSPTSDGSVSLFDMAKG